jgi:hypothetical protein
MVTVAARWSFVARFRMLLNYLGTRNYVQLILVFKSSLHESLFFYKVCFIEALALPMRFDWFGMYDHMCLCKKVRIHVYDDIINGSVALWSVRLLVKDENFNLVLPTAYLDV